MKTATIETRRILCLVFPHWPIQRLFLARPELRGAGQFLVLHRRDARRGERVVDCCPRAQMAGVCAEMALAEVQGLDAGRTGHAPPIFLRYEPAADREALEQLAGRCECFSPVVGLEEGEAPAALLLDVTHSAVCWGGEERLMERLLERFTAEGYAVRGAIAATLGAAWGIAQGAPLQTIRRITPETRESMLAAIPTSHLRLEPTTVETLRRLGIEDLGALLRLPRDGLGIRFGKPLLQRIQQILGRMPEPIRALRPVPSLEVMFPLEHPTERREVLESVLEILAFQLSPLLEARGLGALRLRCAFALRPASETSFEVGLFRPTANPERLTRLLQTRLEHHPLSREIHRVSLHAMQTVRLQTRQASWLEAEDSHPGEGNWNSGELAELLERLTGRLGEHAVTNARLAADPAPEHAFQYQPLTALSRSSAHSSARSSARAAARGPEERFRLHAPPLHLLPQPLPCEVERSHRHAPPRVFHYGHRPHAVRRSLGPERIQTGWWRGQPIARDYYRVEDEWGCRWWLFHDLSCDRWFLHGIYD